jgi:hypothetical protein
MGLQARNATVAITERVDPRQPVMRASHPNQCMLPLSVSFNNALFAVLFSIVVGASAGYVNAALVGALSGLKWTKASRMKSVVSE